MKKLTWFFLTIVLCFGMMSCSESPNNTNPFLSDNHGGITHGVIDPDPIDSNFTLDYSGNEIELTYLLHNSDTANEWGLYIYVAGYQQLFSVDGGEKAYSYCSNFQPNEQRTVKLQFEPVCGKAEELLPISFVVMLRPSMKLSNDQASNGYGAFHTITQMPWQIRIGKGVESNIPTTAYSYKQPVDSETISQYTVVDEDEQSQCLLESSVYFELLDDDDSIKCHIQNKGEALNLCLRAVGYNPLVNSDTLYRISLYVDHKIVPCFDGNSYADILVSKGFVSQINISLPWEVTEGKSHIYIIAAPLTQPDIQEGSLVIMKTETQTIIQKKES